MAKRTPGLEKVVSIIPKAIHELGPKQEREFYQHWVLWHWEDIVGKAYAQNVKAVRIEREVLYVCCRNPAWSNETRYQMPRIIQKVNNYAGGEMIKDIRFSRSWSIADWDAHDAAADTAAKASEAPSVPEVNVGRERAKMPLDAADIKAAETVSEGLEDEDLACKLRQLYRNGRQLDKLRRARGWKPCPTCGHLRRPAGHPVGALQGGLRVRAGVHAAAAQRAARGARAAHGSEGCRQRPHEHGGQDARHALPLPATG